MVKKRSLKSARKTRKISKQKGGIMCDVPNSRAFFKWSANSCYFDTIIIGWLHAADISLRKYLKRMSVISPEDDSRKLIAKRLKNIYDLLHLHAKGIDSEVEAVKKATKLRESLRDSLQTCPEFQRMLEMSGAPPSLESMHSAYEFWNNISSLLNLTYVIGREDYEIFRGYSNNNIQRKRNSGIYPATYRVNEDMKINGRAGIINSVVEKESALNYDLHSIFINDTKMVNVQANPIQYFVENYNLLHNEGRDVFTLDGNYIIKRTLVDAKFGIVPVSINRKKMSSTGREVFDSTKLNLQEMLVLNENMYLLKSIICYTGGGHYVAYYKCEDSDNWIYYNDLSKPLYIPLGPFDSFKDKNMPGYKITPLQACEQLFYFKIE